MSHTLHFEPKISFETVTDVIALLRENDLQKNKFLIVDNAAYLLGGVNAYLADRFQPDEPVPGPNPPPVTPDHPFIAAANQASELSMEELMDQVEDQINNPPEGFGAVEGLNPMLAAFLRQLLQMVLNSLLS